MSESDISQSDTQFIFECLKNLDQDRQVYLSHPCPFNATTLTIQVNLSQVAAALGYSNVASVGNRLRSLRKRYGFVNFEGKLTSVGAKPASSTTPKPDVASKRGRPARVKNTTASTQRLSVEINNNDGEVKPGKRKCEFDGDGNDDDDEQKAIDDQGVSKTARRRKSTAAAMEAATAPTATTDPTAQTSTSTSTSTSSTTSATTHAPGKANSRSVHFSHFPTPSKRRKKQEEKTTNSSLNPVTTRLRKSTPSRRMYRLAAETIREARWERRLRVMREGSLSLVKSPASRPRSGLKLVLKLST